MIFYIMIFIEFIQVTFINIKNIFRIVINIINWFEFIINMVHRIYILITRKFKLKCIGALLSILFFIFYETSNSGLCDYLVDMLNTTYGCVKHFYIVEYDEVGS